MKLSRICVAVLMLCVALVGIKVKAAEEPAVKPVTADVGIHFIVSPGYSSFLDDYYEDYDLSGGYGWLGLQVGMPIRVGNYVEIRPNLSGVFNMVTVQGGSKDEDYANYIIIPAVSAKALMPGKSVRFFIGCEANYNIPSTTSDEVDVSAGGIGGGVFAGVEFQSHGRVELGYEYLPVETSIGDYDFGGVMLRAGYIF